MRRCNSAASASGSRPSATSSKGTLQLPHEGYRSRTTDFLNAHDSDFIALIDADVTWTDGAREPERQEFLAISARHVILVTELESLGVVDEPNPRDRVSDAALALVPAAERVLGLGDGGLDETPPRARRRWPARRPPPRPRRPCDEALDAPAGATISDAARTRSSAEPPLSRAAIVASASRSAAPRAASASSRRPARRRAPGSRRRRSSPPPA